MKFPWRFHPTYLRIKYGCKQILLPLIVFQFIRTILVPTSFDVFLLGLLALLFTAIFLDWL
jgi:hypothetical protein